MTSTPADQESTKSTQNRDVPNACAIIPARGGSKGIPKKNLIPLNGKPMIAWSIEAARNTPEINCIFVSTDDDEIANVAEHYGAEIIRRPANISGDNASSESALLHVVETLNSQHGDQPDLIVFLQATSPVRQPNDLSNAIWKLIDEEADSLFAARHVEGFVWKCSADSVSPVNYDPANRKMRQELDTRILEENGSFYVFRREILQKTKSRLGGKIVPYFMDPMDSFQVDTSEDIERMEMLLKIRMKSEKPDISGIQLLVFDFDGVFTDNRVWVDQDGKEMVSCHRGDGWGLARLRQTDLEMMVISTEKNPVVQARCEKLQLPCHYGCDDKLTLLKQIASERNLSPEQIAYVGNDVNDFECMQWVGCPIAVGDAVPEIKEIALHTTSRHGGDGAVREVADWFSQRLGSNDEK